jgi:hypothetical protein
LTSIRKIIPTLSLGTLLVLVSCTVPGSLQFAYDPQTNGVPEKQSASPLRFGFVTFEDERMVPNGTGMKRMIGWGTNTYMMSTDVDQHVTRAFVSQYRYLGFHAVQIALPPDFSFSSRNWVRGLRAAYPDIDVFVVGKIKDYQFQLGYTGFIEGTGKHLIRTQTNIEAYYIGSRSGKIIWGNTIHHRSRTIVNHRAPLVVTEEKLEATLQQVILDFAARSVPHLDKEFSGAVKLTNKGMTAASANSLASPSVNPDKSPIPAGLGRLVVETAPAGAEVDVDDVFYGTAPLFLDLSPGIHLLKVKMHGYETRRSKIGVFSQKMITWKKSLHEKN